MANILLGNLVIAATSDEEEAELVTFLSGCAKVGYARTRKLIIASVQSYLSDVKGLSVLPMVGGKSFVHEILSSPFELLNDSLIAELYHHLQKSLLHIWKH